MTPAAEGEEPVSEQAAWPTALPDDDDMTHYMKAVSRHQTTIAALKSTIASLTGERDKAVRANAGLRKATPLAWGYWKYRYDLCESFAEGYLESLEAAEAELAALRARLEVAEGKAGLVDRAEGLLHKLEYKGKSREIHLVMEWLHDYDALTEGGA